MYLGKKEKEKRENYSLNMLEKVLINCLYLNAIIII